jgi:SAM-dependent methyltransferase
MNASENIYDPIGEGIAAYFSGKKDTVIQVLSDITEEDIIPVEYLFRSFGDMPEMEQLALQESRGNVLDIGAGAGSHALWLQEKGLPVTALEISKKAGEVMKTRGVKNAEITDLWDYEPAEKFDTILLLMNGLGLAGTVEKLPAFLTKLKSWLKDDGQILLESSDIWYMFEAEDGSISFDLNAAYYGEVTYQMAYNSKVGPPFPWLFLAPDLLEDYASQNGFTTEFLFEGDNFQYLARLRKI